MDIAPYLRQGKNTLAAVVWNYGEKRPMAQMGTNEIALLVCADGADPVFNTDWNWQVLTGESYSSLDDFVVPGYYAADRGERFDANNYPWGWQTEQEAPDSIGSKPGTWMRQPTRVHATVEAASLCLAPYHKWRCARCRQAISTCH